MALSSAESVGKLVVRCSRSALVDIPLAATEGIRAVPRLYGEAVADYGAVSGWKSGAVIGGKTFVNGTTDGLTGPVLDPYHGAKEGGVWGLTKGIGKGTIGLTTKTTSAALGVLVYPGQGLFKSVRATMKSSTQHAIRRARCFEGECLADGNTQANTGFVLDAFEKLKDIENDAHQL